MKLELVKEQKYNQEPFYEIRLDDVYIIGSYDKVFIDAEFDKIEANPNLVETKKEILVSREI